jgi:hypothetical protein
MVLYKISKLKRFPIPSQKEGIGKRFFWEELLELDNRLIN